MSDPTLPNELEADITQTPISDTVTEIADVDSAQTSLINIQTETMEERVQTIETENSGHSDDSSDNGDDDSSEVNGSISEESGSFEDSEDDQAYMLMEGDEDIDEFDQTGQNVDPSSTEISTQDTAMEGEFIFEINPSTGQQRAVQAYNASSASSASGRLRTSLVARLLRQHRRMTTPVRARHNSSRSSAGPRVSATEPSAGLQGLISQTTSKPVIDENAQSELRKKIIEIQKDASISFPEKASMIQKLMVAGRETQTKPVEHPVGNESIEPTEEDMRATYVPKLDGVLGCKHYQRGCKLKANCCGKWFNCRFCHDEVCDHDMVRTETRTILCMHCKAVQPAAKSCGSCQTTLARYYCDVCKLWDDNAQDDIYHCTECGICRKGKDNDYFHCSKCNVCMNVHFKDNHKCIERNLECDCPICGEYMFTSRSTIIFMQCGHGIHSKCFNEYTNTSYQCPTCWKSLGDMTAYYKRIDSILAEETMPPGYENVFSTILCNDCEIKSEASYHFLYHKCDKCKGYNTKVLGTFKRTASDVPNAPENTISSGDSGNVPENIIDVSNSVIASSSSGTHENGSTSISSTVTQLPEISRTPEHEGNTAENMGYEGENSSTRSSET